MLVKQAMKLNERLMLLICIGACVAKKDHMTHTFIKTSKPYSQSENENDSESVRLFNVPHVILLLTINLYIKLYIVVDLLELYLN